MTPTIDLKSKDFTDYIVYSVSYQKKEHWWGPAQQSFFWYDNDKDLKRLVLETHENLLVPVVLRETCLEKQVVLTKSKKS